MIPPNRQGWRGISPGTLVFILLVLVLVLLALWMIAHRRPAAPPDLPATTWPDRNLTPGAVDPVVTDDAICAHDWSPGNPPQRGGDMTYSRAARHTSSHIKNAVFAAYHIANPHDGGHTWEIDHLVPLALGGRDVIENLWPESRAGEGMNAWAKDRLEYRLYRLVCNPAPGAQPMSLAQAQTAIRTDWVAAYRSVCANEADCPAFSGE
jgi:hypothetical protein